MLVLFWGRNSGLSKGQVFQLSLLVDQVVDSIWVSSGVLAAMVSSTEVLEGVVINSPANILLLKSSCSVS